MPRKLVQNQPPPEILYGFTKPPLLAPCTHRRSRSDSAILLAHFQSYQPQVCRMRLNRTVPLGHGRNADQVSRGVDASHQRPCSAQRPPCRPGAPTSRCVYLHPLCAAGLCSCVALFRWRSFPVACLEEDFVCVCVPRCPTFVRWDFVSSTKSVLLSFSDKSAHTSACPWVKRLRFRKYEQVTAVHCLGLYPLRPRAARVSQTISVCVSFTSAK